MVSERRQKVGESDIPASVSKCRDASFKLPARSFRILSPLFLDYGHLAAGAGNLEIMNPDIQKSKLTVHPDSTLWSFRNVSSGLRSVSGHHHTICSLRNAN